MFLDIRSVAKIYHETKAWVILGKLDSVKDWDYAKDYLYEMWKMLQLDYSDDFVLGVVESLTLREFAEAAFKETKIELEWFGSGFNEVGLFNDETTV